MNERIDIKQFDLANEKVVNSVALYIELTDNSLMYYAEYYAEVPAAEDKDDHSLGWKESFQKFKIKVKRSSLVSVEKSWNDKREYWKVEVEASGYPNSIAFYFELESEAEAVYEKLDTYVFGAKLKQWLAL